jgi:hypothetical protein
MVILGRGKLDLGSERGEHETGSKRKNKVSL